MNKAESIFLISIALIVIGIVTTVFTGLRMAAKKAEDIIIEPMPTVAEETIEETESTEATEATETQPTTVYYDVPLSEDLQYHIITQAEVHGIDPAIVFAVVWKESTFYSKAVGDGGNSLGLMQIQPRWHSGRMEKLGCTDLFDPYQNIVVGVDYLAENLNRYGSIDKALTAYNAGHYNGTVTSYATEVMALAEEVRGAAK